MWRGSMKILKIAIAGVLLLMGSILLAQNKPSSIEPNKKIVVDFYRFVWEPKDDAALMKILPENYVEHNPVFKNGRTDLANFLKTLRKGQPPAKVADKLKE